MGTPNYGNCLFTPCPMLKCWFIFISNSWGIPRIPWWVVKNLPEIRETGVQSLGWEDLLENEMATHSSILAWKIPCMEDPGRLPFMGSLRVGHDWATSLHFTSLHWKDWCWSSNTLATWCKEPTHWKGPQCWERLGTGREGDDRGDGWMVSLSQWTWAWANFGK